MARTAKLKHKYEHTGLEEGTGGLIRIVVMPIQLSNNDGMLRQHGHGYVSSTSKTGMPAFGVDEGGFAATDCKGFL